MSALELHNPPFSTSSALGRFRVIDRRPATNVRRSRRRLAHPFQAAIVYTGVPACLLVLYVALWTAAVHGGYQEQRITRQIQQLRVENQSLQADVLRLQSSTRILQRAAQLHMQEPDHVEYIVLPARAPVRER